MQIKNQGKTKIIKIKRQKISGVKKLAPVNPDQSIVEFVKRNHQAATDYRQKFKPRWDAIIGQIRCQHPLAWNQKEDWQSKVFIPQQAKKAETAAAYLDKMLFGQKRFFSIQGNEQQDKQKTGYISDLYDVVFERGNFYFENDFILKESAEIGTGFLKMLVKSDRSGIDFIWRSAYNISFDPTCGYNFHKAKFVCDEYKRTIDQLVDDLSNPNPLYTRASIQKVIDAAGQAAQGKSDEDLTFVKGIDGTSQVKIARDWYEVNIVEYWGKAKVSYEEMDGENTITKYKVVNKIITIVNNQVKIREEENPYGFNPIFPCRIKPRGYDSYGLGFCENTMDLQDLTNSMINLGFDSLKLCSMDIAVIDATKIKDPASIEYRPMATWFVKGNPREAVSLQRQGISALGEIIRGLGILDQFDQEASGVLRQVQGAPEIGGGSSETLGEYQAKLAMIDNRFLKIGRFIERDYIEPVLKAVFKILFNPKFFNQRLIDRILGMREIDIPVIDPMSGQQIMIKQQASKLNFDQVAREGDMAFDFKATGMTQFTKSIQTLQKLKELLSMVIGNPQMMILFKIEEVVKRVMQAAEIGDYQDMMKSDEEIKAIMQQIYSGGSQQNPISENQPGAQMAGGV